MKTNSTNTMKAGLMVLALQLGFTASALAGGPGRLQLPLEGVTAKNSAQCTKLFEERLSDFLAKGNGTRSGRGHVRMIKDGSTNLVQLEWVRGQLSLSEIERAIEGSPFSIKREELEYIGLVRLRIEKVTNLKKLISALADLDGKKLSTETVKDKDGTLLITLRDPKLMNNPLFTHQRLTSYLSQNKINLIAISWGDTHCSAPFGARPAAKAVTKR